ncbi:MAG: S-methyl-5-thioribose-1-phosphate isomerase [Candidatus Omnitrophica bacterium]|nr:S-methyl-5-thioribose-1-phosphate isomerase [Candidatus Omnitrophota bacterium]MCM8776843.1 S-methyl-5-thioribose-1-phosphate isomerase [Candidatus Omnitrophota bacterium]
MIKPIIKTLWWENGRLYIIDQRVLPEKERILELKNIRDVWESIRNLSIRGAPAIGCVAAYGVTLSALRIDTKDSKGFIKEIKSNIKYLKTSRPTAYNLFFALSRMERVLEEFSDMSISWLKERLLKEAENIYREDLDCCYKIGVNGARLIQDNMNILTHCNAGGLATSGYGTALAVFFTAKKQKKKFNVFVNETRPVLQGARLTTWELKKAGIPYTLICDNMAGYLMNLGRIDMIITGADRIAKNGDTANKIGTYSLAVLAKYHKVDFYIAAPYSTFDPSIKNGKDIPVEERDAEEVRKIKGRLIAPSDAPVYNPAFDITPTHLIKGFITEDGIIKKPGGWLSG